jgi:hypothetical protein
VRLLRAPSLEKLPHAPNARSSWAGWPATVSTLTSTSTTRTHPRERAKSSSQQRRCCEPCPLLQRPRRRTCTVRRTRSSSRRLCNRPKARRPAFASRAVRGRTVARRGRRRQFTRAVRRDNPPTRAKRRSGCKSSTHADRPRTATPVTSSTPVEQATRRRGQW